MDNAKQRVMRYIKFHPAAGYVDVAIGCGLDLREAVRWCKELAKEGRVNVRPAAERGRNVGK